MRSAAIALALALVAAAPAQAKTGPLVDHGEGTQLEADARFATWVLPDGSRRVFDTRTRAVSDVPARPDCAPAGIAAAQLVWHCDLNGPSQQHGQVARYVHLATGATRDVALIEGELGPPSIVDAGAHWVWSHLTDHRGGRHYDFNPVDGGPGRIDPQQSERTYFDVNHRELTRTMCAPLRMRRLDGSDFGSDLYEPYQYERPYGLHAETEGDIHQLLLERCGGEFLPLLSVEGGRFPLIGNLYRANVSWWQPETLRLRVVRPTRRYSWRLTGASPQAVDHTKYRVLGQSGGRIYSAKIPRP